MPDCIFCDIQHDEKAPAGVPIFADELVYAYHDAPTYIGHIILITRRHTPDFASLTRAEARAVGMLITRLSAALKSVTSAEKVYAVFYGEVTPHLHVHLTARYPNTPPDYLRWKVEGWPEAPRGNDEDIAALCHKLRAALKENAHVA